MKVGLFVLAISLVQVVPASAQCTGQPFGTALGTFNNVTAYSNCNPTFDSRKYDRTGLEWQCVEFVRRYYLNVYGAPTSKSNLGNADQWYDNYSQLGLMRFQNGGTTAPQIGDILTSKGPSGSNGHVAIVSSVSSNKVCAVMQNWSENHTDVDGSHCMTLSASGSHYSVGAFNAAGTYPVQGWLRWPTTVSATPATMVAPANGSTLASSSVTFHWTTGTAIQQYFLYVGTSVGGNNIYGQSQGTNLSATINGLPTDGSTLYVRLWSLDSSGWMFNDYAYTAARIGVTPVAASMTYPNNGSNLASSSVTFHWTTGTAIQEYFLYVGSSSGTNDIYGRSQGTNVSVTVNGLPTDGRTLYIRLWSRNGTLWYYRDYTYKAL